MGIVLIAVVGLGMGILLTRRLRKLTHAAQRLAAGESAVETGLRGRDEIAQVGGAFDTMARNIADSRQQLEDTHAFLQSTLDSLSSHIAILDGSGTILSVNDVWRRFAEANAFFGVSYGVGANYLAICDKAEGECAEEAPQVAQGIREVMAQQRTHFELDYPCHSPEHSRWFVVKVTCFESPDGLRVVVAHENITALKQSEEALRQSEAQIRAVLDTAVDSIISITEQGTIISFNSAAERLFGYRAEEVRGQNVTVLMPPPYHEEHDRYLTQYLLTDEKKIIGIGREVVGKRKDGTTFPMDLAVGEAQIGDQRFFTGIVRDITERKQAEAALRQAHNELEQRVRDRTADLEVANEEVRRFAYIVSHDLRAPLINLKGFAGELRDLCELLNTILPQLLPHLDDPQRTEVMRAITQDGPEALHFIETSVTRMDGLIRAVLDLSRAGQSELHIEPVDTEALAQHIAQTLTHQLAQHDARITIEPLPTVNADRMAMEQILGNLLGNAVKYLEPGRPGEITVRAEREANTTTFHVCDNGRGIAEGDLPRVFELFRRAGRQDTQGEGMGLAFVQTLIRRHGGEMTCRSTLGGGTTFTFTIPHHLVSGDSDAIA
jgi:PAS domain S-box-containing protein